jgi:hypothetical protein
MAEQPPLSATPSLRTFAPTLLIDGACPFLTYQLLTTYAPSISTVRALIISGMFPLAHSVIGLVRRRYLDIIGIIVLVGIAVSLAATMLGGGAKLLLLRESFVTGALGLVGLSSFAWSRPLMFYIGQQFSSGGDAEARRRFDALWEERPRARRTFRILTLVWAVGWLGEFVLRVVMIESLTVAQVLAISPIVFNAINIGLMAWTFAYVRRVRSRASSAPRG